MWQRASAPLTYYTTMHLCVFKKDNSILKVSFIFFINF